ncbi:hypothetical protein NC653_038863 [Populus alba x Populus x berolinensis]|uniref:Uncharacterized protein n=1 Tax=Populus alba x Populus x berolinensis TaxID=444605 RepID=A0AAD6PTV8_9ROSI|nr:hypothetical protein NC653_038863 [Populus alba x Populus x berolinensis]
MAAENEDSSTATTMTNTTTLMTFVDEAYEFSAPKVKLVLNRKFGSGIKQLREAFMPRIKTGRSFKVEALCDFSQADQFHKVAESSDSKASDIGVFQVSAGEITCEKEKKVGFACAEGNGSFSIRSTSSLRTENTDGKESSKNEAYCTPKPPMSSRNRGPPPNVKNVAGTTNLAQENQAIKKQKLEGGRSRQVYVREQAAPGPFVSTAEMMNKFQSNTRGLSMPHLNNSISHDGPASVIQRKPKLTLTRPKEPEFETAQRVRSVKIKSSAEM